MNCRNCGKPLEPGNRFCIYCGTNISTDNEKKVRAAPTVLKTRGILVGGIVIIVAVIAVVIMLLNRNPLVGEWRRTEDGATLTIILNKDGTGFVSMYNNSMDNDTAAIEYRTQDGILTLYNDDTLVEFVYSVKGDTLTIKDVSDPEEESYQRVR